VLQVHSPAVVQPRLLPLLHRPVAAGFPSPADDFIEDEIDLQRLLITNRPATFLVRVAGDSMVGKQLFDGDLAVVDRSLVPRNGDVVVVDVDGERSFKVWFEEAGEVRLAFANPRYPEFELTSASVVEVWGVVSGSINPRRRAHR
jgi:DNA polymerase V